MTRSLNISPLSVKKKVDKKVVQIDLEFKVVNEFDSVKQASELFGVNRAGIDQALRTGYQCCQFFWMYKKDYEEGQRPDISKQIRNTEVYAYNPYINKIRDQNEFNYSKFQFIGRYKNAVECSKELKISVSNIRWVCKKQKDLHKGYWFSYAPLQPIHDFLGDIQEAYIRDLQVRTKFGVANLLKVKIYPEIYVSLETVGENIESKLFQITDLEELREIIVKIIDPIKKLHSKENKLK